MQKARPDPRTFKRLLSLTMKNLPVKGLNAVSNHCTLAHITCLGIALTASQGYP